MSKIVGIDLGTTNSLVATVDSGIPLVIADATGNRLTPSVVHYGADGEVLVGHPASRLRVLKPRETFYSVKRFMGRRGRDISADERRVAYPLQAEGEAPARVQCADRPRLPEEVSAEILRKLKRDAEAYLEAPVTRAVITVPAYFNNAQRSATQRAGEMAGFTVERIINEPTAAALAYGLDRVGDRSKIAVFDLGGGTFDLSILELHEGAFQVLSTSGDTLLGGDDLDQRLLEFFLERIRSAGGPNLGGDFSALSRLREAAEQTKIKLSLEEAVEVALPFLGGFNFALRVTRPELESITRDIVERTRLHCLKALADAKIEPEALGQVILVGGQTRMPLVRKLVADWFHCSNRPDAAKIQENKKGSGPRLNTSQNPDESVALGAAIQGEILSGGFKNVLLLDVTPLSLGIETFGGLMNVIIPRNTTIPVKAGELFTTAVHHQRSMSIHVLQGERERSADNWSLGRFEIQFEPLPRGIARVGVQFEIDANGILHVLARDIQTGGQKIVDMKSAVDVDDADVERMVEESVHHAFDDLRARQWIEAKLKAGETLTAARHGLESHGSALLPDQAAGIAAGIDKLKQIIEAPAAGEEVGDLDRLKAATRELDDSTQPLAEIMLDQVMEKVLKKRGLIS